MVERFRRQDSYQVSDHEKIKTFRKAQDMIVREHTFIDRAITVVAVSAVVSTIVGFALFWSGVAYGAYWLFTK